MTAGRRSANLAYEYCDISDTGMQFLYSSICKNDMSNQALFHEHDPEMRVFGSKCTYASLHNDESDKPVFYISDKRLIHYLSTFYRSLEQGKVLTSILVYILFENGTSKVHPFKIGLAETLSF